MEFEFKRQSFKRAFVRIIILTFLKVGYTSESEGSDHARHKHDTPAPDFLPSPSNVTFHKGELAVLRCSVYNLGTKTVVWRRLESSFPLTSGTMTVVADTRLQIGHVEYKNQWDLMIKNVQPDDEGVYECQVASRDKTIRKLVQLTVIADPETSIPEIKITEQQYVERGESITLQCNATGEYYPPDEMDWFRNGQRLSSEDGVSISKQYSLSKRTFTSNLYIERTTMNDGGTYVCRTSSMQIASTKVHVLNAETYNRKRGTLDEGEEKSGKMSAMPSSSTSSTFNLLYLAIVIIISCALK